LKVSTSGKGLYIGLIHYPVYNKKREVVATSITTIDLHDFSRICRTYEVDRLYIVTPLESQRKLAQRIFDHWISGYGARCNPSRREAILRAVVKTNLEEVIGDIESIHSRRPKMVLTGARPSRASITYPQLRKQLEKEGPVIILFGTGWGMEESLMQRADFVLSPIQENKEYNHLPVRAAVAITLDRLLGDRE